MLSQPVAVSDGKTVVLSTKLYNGIKKEYQGTFSKYYGSTVVHI